MKKETKILVLLGLFAILGLNVHQMAAQGESPPNFVFILTDDHRYDMLGCTGNSIVQTPNIDQLAKEGILFTNAHVTSAICTPSRASIFLSQFERKHGVNFNSGTSVSEEAWVDAYPMRLREGGYYTGYIGKNHVPVGEGGYDSGVMEQSFDYWYAGHGHLSFYPKKRHDIFKGAKNDTQVEIIDEGVSDFFSNEQKLAGAKHFLNSRPTDQPFCLSICFNLPHGAGTSSMKLLDTDPEIYRNLYRDKAIPLPDNYLEKSAIKTPKLPPDIHFANERQVGYNYVDKKETTQERLIRSMQTVTGIDQLVGNLRQTLQAKGLAGNTIIVFTSDHGLFFGEFGLGGKALCYETTTHVPMIIHNPMVTESAKGIVSDELVQTIDVAPTLLSYAGLELPSSFQGKPLNHLIAGSNQSIRDYLFTENLWSTQFGNPRCESVQDKDWKYIRYYKNENLRASVKIEAAKLVGMKQNEMLYGVHDPDIAVYRHFAEASLQGEPPVYEELYHLKKDPQETTNVATKRKYQKQLKKLQRAWKEKIKYARGEGVSKVVRYTKDYPPKPTSATTPKTASQERPNILIIVSDDHGWGDVGFNGGTDIPTPNLDKLAAEGISFEAGYASHPYCSPSRAGLITGRYQQRFGHENNTTYSQNNPDSGLPLEELPISQLLQENGYRTCAIGKWHLGDNQKFWPINRGFDDWFGFAGGGMSYWGTPKKGKPLNGVLRNGQPVPLDQLNYLTDDFSNAAVDYIDTYSKSEQPFLMYLAYNAPHGPIQATKEYLDLMDHAEFGDRAAYGAMVVGMDVGIGKVIAKLKETSEYDNTLIIFYSDNGGHSIGANSLPFRGHKGMLFEGGIRVPFLVSWPNGINGGSRFKEAISALDIYPTVLAASGITHPHQEKLDGVNLLPFLNGENQQPPHDKLFWRYSDGAGYAVRKGHNKMIYSAFKDDFFLFDLEKDPYEHHNLATQFPDKLAALKADYLDWSKGLIPSKWSDPHIENVKKEESRRQQFIDKAMAGEKH